MNRIVDRKERWIKFWANSCLRKVRYSNRKRASRACVKNAKNFKVNFSIYYCDNCCGYHLTTKV